jgi:hypothetical protein
MPIVSYDAVYLTGQNSSVVSYVVLYPRIQNSPIFYVILCFGTWDLGLILTVGNLGENKSRRPVIKVIYEEYFLLKYDLV